MRFASLALLVVATPAIAAPPITGRWITDNGKAIVAIAPCGPAMCGHVADVLAKRPGGPAVDSNNPDPKLRSRPIKGIEVLSGFHADGDEWKGQIYNPEEGKTYRSIIERAGADALKVKGCVLFFCKTQTWTRAR
jgi:uncharacterized protein (DUF2147 family)